MRLCFAEFGPVADDLRRMDRAEPETYRAQYYSLRYLRELRDRADAVCTITLRAPTPVDEELNGIRHVGINVFEENGPAAFAQTLASFSPSHIIVRGPLLNVLETSLATGARVLPMLADSFGALPLTPRGLMRRWDRRRLVQCLNSDAIPYVSNHNSAACRDLARIGVRPDKIVPWDWPSANSPEDFAPKPAPKGGPYKAVYVGKMADAKGVGDIIAMLKQDAWCSENLSVDFIGKGTEPFEQRAEQEGVAAKTSFLGRLPNQRVLDVMRDADVVLVPSHHSYPEGLPGTIYEGLTVRTPVVLTDHPMFSAYFTEGAGVTFAAEQSPSDLARAVRDTVTNADRYVAMSQQTANAFDAIRCPSLYHEVLDHWLSNDAEGYLARHAKNWSKRFPDIRH